MRFALTVLIAAAAVAPRPAGAQSEPAWDDYHRAFVLLAEGRPAEARALLRQVVERNPGSPVGALARVRIGEIESNLIHETEEGVLGAERPRKLARAELGLWSTINGISAGLNLCLIAECDGTRQFAAALMAGGAAGLGAALFATRDGITQGRTQLTNSSIFWGNVNGYLINTIAFGDPFGVDDDEERTAAGISLGSQAVGLAASFGLWEVWRPSSGDVALSNTTGLWTPILVLLVHGVADTEPKAETILVAIDAGLVAGGVLSTRYRMSRGRTLLIDVGGLVGGLTGGLAVAIAQPDSSAGAFAPLLVTTSAGLAVATWATRDWDIPEVDAAIPAVGIAPMGDHGWGAKLSFGADL